MSMNENIPSSKVIAKRLLKLVLPYKGWIFFSIICMGGYTFLNTVPAIYIKDIVDALAYGESPKLHQFFFVGLAIVAVFSLKGLFFFGQNYGLGLMVQRLLAKLRLQLFSHLQQLSMSFFARNKTGDLISRFTNDLQVLQMTLNITVTGPFRDIPQILFLLVVMGYRSWRLLLLTIVMIPIALFFIRLFGRLNKVITSERQVSFGNLTNFLVEVISGIRIVKAFGMERYETERFKEANDDLYNNYMRSIRIASYSSPVIETIGAAAGASIVSYGGYLIIQDQITAGDFVSFLVSFLMLNEPVKKLNGFNLKLQEGLAALHRVFAVMDTRSDIEEAPGAVELNRFEKEVAINIQRFNYPGYEIPALESFEFTVQKGEVVAFVGSSGAGKSTLMNLLPRFYDVTLGGIRIDGNDIRDINLDSLRAQMAIVTQETILFNDSIANNITYGHPECSEERMIEGAKAANAHRFIMELPEGYHTNIGEKGVKLSGGQRQRLAIARALIKDAPILILDEATSALDSESEVEVQQAIERLMENRTTFVIAHRLSTIRHADRIYVLERGKIIESGTHDHLLQLGGRYKELYMMQFQETAHEPNSLS